MERIEVIKLPIGRLIGINQLEDGSYEVRIGVDKRMEGKVDSVAEMPELDVTSCQLVVDEEEDTDILNFDDVFRLVEASKLSFCDKFMHFVPVTECQKVFKKLLCEVIRAGIKDFYRPIFDPSFSNEGNGICYIQGCEPAVGKSYEWWEKTSKAFCRKRKSRLGTKSEYIAFLGCLIKELVEDGCGIRHAWEAVCDNSRGLGHYMGGNGRKCTVTVTGSSGLSLDSSFFDLGNTRKILAEDEENDGFWVAGGSCGNRADYRPLANLSHKHNRNNHPNSRVGWLVVEK